MPAPFADSTEENIKQYNYKKKNIIRIIGLKIENNNINMN